MSEKVFDIVYLFVMNAAILLLKTQSIRETFNETNPCQREIPIIWAGVQKKNRPPNDILAFVSSVLKTSHPTARLRRTNSRVSFPQKMHPWKPNTSQCRFPRRSRTPSASRLSRHYTSDGPWRRRCFHRGPCRGNAITRDTGGHRSSAASSHCQITSPPRQWSPELRDTRRVWTGKTHRFVVTSFGWFCISKAVWLTLIFFSHSLSVSLSLSLSL